MNMVYLFCTDGEHRTPTDEDGSIGEALGPVVHAEFIKEESIILFYSPVAFRDANTSPNMAFEQLIRPTAPYAPQFRGPLVFMGGEPFNIATLQEFCAIKWGKRPMPNAEDIPPELVPFFLNSIPQPTSEEATVFVDHQ